MQFLIGFCLLCMIGGPLTDEIIFDTFDVGAATRDDDADDPSDAQWYEVWVNVNLGISTDSSGIDDGQLLQVISTSPLQTITAAPFGTSVAFDSVGDTLSITCDFRLLMSNTTGFRFGVHDQGASPMTSDASSYNEAEDDDGYIVFITSSSGDVGLGGFAREREDIDYLSPTSGDSVEFPPVEFKHSILGTTPHSVEFNVRKVGSGTELEFFIDAKFIASTIDDTVDALSQFNSLAIGSFNNDILVDNVRVTYEDKIPGDVNKDGAVNLLDVGPFVSLLGSGSYQFQGDVNNDGQLNLLDVDPFVSLLAGD